MIEFKKISIKNFMSVGNSPIEINYTANKTTIVTATNGSGKSSIMLDSITFALYGKPYRNINKPQLINSINQKDCVVELWFKVNKTEYRIKRGIKPIIFEIYKDGKLMNQDAASRDYQKILENNILKMNYRTFTQVVIMGSGNYIPFMRLPVAQRREFVEDILDIKIFSIMNMLLKQQMADSKESKRELELKIKSIKEKIKMQKDFIDTLQSAKTEQIEKFEENINSMMTEITIAETEIESLSLKESELLKSSDDLTDVTSEYNRILSELKGLQSTITKIEQQYRYFEDITECPTCRQSVNSDHKNHMFKDLDLKKSSLLLNIEDLQISKLPVWEKKLQSLKVLQDELLTIQSKIGDLNTSISSANKIIKKYNQQIIDLKKNNSSVSAETAKLKELAKEGMKLNEQKTDLNELGFYHDVALALLKDSGIKTKIIKQYLPVFNNLINKFLQQLDFFVSFNLDENFNEVVKSRHRDTFTYESFSEGEKQRLDLALLFTFREIARLKNSLHVNLLLMDETLDSSLDAAGIDSFFNILDGVEKSNVFVISHREGMTEKFDSHLHIEKQSNFSVIATP